MRLHFFLRKDIYAYPNLYASFYLRHGDRASPLWLFSSAYCADEYSYAHIKFEESSHKKFVHALLRNRSPPVVIHRVSSSYKFILLAPVVLNVKIAENRSKNPKKASFRAVLKSYLNGGNSLKNHCFWLSACHFLLKNGCFWVYTVF